MLIDQLIAQGMKNNAEFTEELIRIKSKLENASPKKRVADLETQTQFMEDIDSYTLDKTQVTDTDIVNMKEIDDFTLDKVIALEQRIVALEGE